MNVKGIAVRATYNYVKDKYPERFAEWLNSLPHNSKKIFTNQILPSEWYPAYDAVIVPTKLIGTMFLGTPEKAADEVGRYSAREALKGVYKIFARLSSINYIIKRSVSIYSNYWDTGKFTIISNEKGNSMMRLSEIPDDFYLVIHRVAGWIFEIPLIMKKNLKKYELKKVQRGRYIDGYFYIEWE